MNTIDTSVDAASRRAAICDIIIDYPSVDEDELAELLHWFRKEATALDVALIASEPAVQKGYQRFKADHLDRLRGTDMLRVTLIAIIVGAAIIVAFWLAA